MISWEVHGGSQPFQDRYPQPSMWICRWDSVKMAWLYGSEIIKRLCGDEWVWVNGEMAAYPTVITESGKRIVLGKALNSLEENKMKITVERTLAHTDEIELGNLVENVKGSVLLVSECYPASPVFTGTVVASASQIYTPGRLIHGCNKRAFKKFSGRIIMEQGGK